MSTYEDLHNYPLRIGTKQTMKALEQGICLTLFVAEDADDKVTNKAVVLANKLGVKIVHIASMKQLGMHCGIEVGSAMAAIVNE
jgi:large subunit ribosomal protein L7A